MTLLGAGGGRKALQAGRVSLLLGSARMAMDGKTRGAPPCLVFWPSRRVKQEGPLLSLNLDIRYNTGQELNGGLSVKNQLPATQHMFSLAEVERWTIQTPNRCSCWQKKKSFHCHHQTQESENQLFISKPASSQSVPSPPFSSAQPLPWWHCAQRRRSG